MIPCSLARTSKWRGEIARSASNSFSAEKARKWVTEGEQTLEGLLRLAETIEPIKEDAPPNYTILR